VLLWSKNNIKVETDVITL